MDQAIKPIAFTYDTKFGVEVELCSFDDRDFKKEPLQKGELPEGITDCADILMASTPTPVEITKWGHTHGNDHWVLKSDSSCGIEVCTPVSRGWLGLKNICKGIEALRADKRVRADRRCGLHVHVSVEDASMEQVASVIAHWVKAEAVFLDSVPDGRKRNRYCQQIGLTQMFNTDAMPSPNAIVSQLGQQKYYTLNTFHYVAGKRHTVEFRIMEGEGCLNPFYIKNWVRLLVHFVEQARKRPLPGPYVAGNPWSSFCWLDPEDVMRLLGFDGPLSKGMAETRNWFLGRIGANIKSTLPGVWSEDARRVARRQVYETLPKEFGVEDLAKAIQPPPGELLYAEELSK